jgi:hypothetical protein
LVHANIVSSRKTERSTNFVCSHGTYFFVFVLSVLLAGFCFVLVLDRFSK